MTAREELIGFCLAALPNEPGFAKAEALADAYRAEVVDDLIERCAVALRGCCPECDIAIQLIRRRGDVVKGVAS